MHDRRDFLKTTALATSLIAVGSVSQALGDETAPAAPSYKNIVYTKEQPGKWAAKAPIHAPEITVNGSKVTVVTKHPMSAEHYIVRHTLVLADGTPVGGKTFTPTDKPESSYDLPAGYKGKLYATSFCNLHDFWVSVADA